jgi:hypothetical protein
MTFIKLSRINAAGINHLSNARGNASKRAQVGKAAGVTPLLRRRQVRLTASLQGPLLGAAFLAGVFDPCLSRSRRDAVWCPALAALGLDPGITLLNGDGFALQGLFDETLSLFAHLLL